MLWYLSANSYSSTIFMIIDVGKPKKNAVDSPTKIYVWVAECGDAVSVNLDMNLNFQ